MARLGNGVDWNDPDDLELHHSCLLSGIRDTAQKKCLCMPGLLFPFLLVSTWEYGQKQSIMLAGISKAQY